VHILTKILLVIVAILSVLLSALTIAYTANATALKTSVTNLQARAAAAEASAASANSEAGQQRATDQERVRALEEKLRSQQQVLDNLQQERTELRASKDKAETEAAGIRAQISQFVATTDTQSALIKSQREEVTQLRDSFLSAQRREIELVDRVNELEGSREVLEQNARALKEQLEETKLALVSAQQAVTTGQSGAASGAAKGLTTSLPVELPGAVVRAGVDDVFRSPTGDSMVVISEGASRGIKENSVLHVIRGTDQFIGSIVITTVEPGRAVGKLNTFGRGGVAQRGDVALSRLY
jgi:predicted  nucleic acid-binding Zn-ribbon protein